MSTRPTRNGPFNKAREESRRVVQMQWNLNSRRVLGPSSLGVVGMVKTGDGRDSAYGERA